MKKIKALFLVIVVTAGIYLWLSHEWASQPQKRIVHVISQMRGLTPTSFPFEDLTIPHLRSRTYNSSLGDLEKVAEKQNYTSYITSYKSDGLTIYGLLTQPKGEMPVGGWPGIIFIHGYIPPTLYKTQSQYASYVDYLARNGFVVFKIDLRGHDRSEGDPGGAYYSSDYIIDTLNAYSALQKAGFVNPKRIGLWGHSMAGNVVLRSLVSKPDIPAAVIWAGAVYSYRDFLEFRINDNSFRPPQMSSQRQRRREQLFAAHGEFSEDSSFWRMVAPTNYLNDLTSSIELHHAVDDTVVDIRYSRNLMNLFDQTSVLHKLYEYEVGGHNITGLSFSKAMERTVKFFREEL